MKLINILLTIVIISTFSACKEKKQVKKENVTYDEIITFYESEASIRREKEKREKLNKEAKRLKEEIKKRQAYGREQDKKILALKSRIKFLKERIQKKKEEKEARKRGNK